MGPGCEWGPRRREIQSEGCSGLMRWRRRSPTGPTTSGGPVADPGGSSVGGADRHTSQLSNRRTGGSGASPPNSNRTLVVMSGVHFPDLSSCRVQSLTTRVPVDEREERIRSRIGRPERPSALWMPFTANRDSILHFLEGAGMLAGANAALLSQRRAKADDAARWAMWSTNAGHGARDDCSSIQNQRRSSTMPAVPVRLSAGFRALRGGIAAMAPADLTPCILLPTRLKRRWTRRLRSRSHISSCARMATRTAAEEDDDRTTHLKRSPPYGGREAKAQGKSMSSFPLP